nr:hypothetical protein [Mycobacterium szulgai]
MPAPPVRDKPAAPAHTLVVADRTVRLISLGGPPSDRLLSRVAGDIGTAVDAVVAFWGADWPHDISVVAAGSREQFLAAVGGGPASQWADIAAVTVADSVDPQRRVALGERIVFAPDADTMSAAALRIVLSHELFHYAARAVTAMDAPRWLTEGVADFVARPATSLPTAAVTAPRSLPLDDDLDAPGRQRSLAYDRAWLFARFVADSYGPARLREFYLATCGVGHADIPAATRDVLGTDEAGLLARWQQWLAG